jgi:hypothetical protein
MAALHALLIGGGLLALALVVMTYRGGVTPGRLIAIFLLAVITSAGSAIHERQRSSGTGTLESRGFPKPFHFRWQDFEQRDKPRADINFLFFGANTFVHLGVMSLFGAMILRRHAGDPARKMHAGMVVVRITLGIVFLILGVIGGFIPILQGWIFILLGILVLFPKAKFTEKILHKAEPKVPRTVRFLRRLGIGADEEAERIVHE